VKVADGYGRNFLLPRKLALQATLANKAVIEHHEDRCRPPLRFGKGTGRRTGAKLEPLVLSFTRKSGEAGHLFGSVTSADIAADLAAKGFEVDRRKIAERAAQEPRRPHCRHQAAPRSHRAREG
jgi:large subunit ribosomal protein L9